MQNTGKLASGLKKLEKAMKKNKCDDAIDQFNSVMKTFHQNASKRIQPFKKKIVKLDSEVKKVLILFACNPRKFTMEDLFALLNEFINDWKNSEVKIQKEKEIDAKDKRRANAKKKAQNKKQLQRSESQLGKIDEVMEEINCKD